MYDTFSLGGHTVFIVLGFSYSDLEISLKSAGRVNDEIELHYG